jgi:nucleoside-diphosphate-sugar epimerase
MRILISGACGFVGSTLARALAKGPGGSEILGIDNFVRPGSETNRAELKRLGVKLFHGDLRVASDLESLPPSDWVIDAAANPSVLAGVDGKSSSRQLVEHNLGGTINLLEYCKRHGAGFILISTSRVYSIGPLAALATTVEKHAFKPSLPGSKIAGLSAAGVDETFATGAPISLYGATKLASEALALEYGETFSLPVFINRCGVLAGAGQFGRPDQGIFAYWLNSWLRRQPLKYIGFGGQGHQVRDCLHPRDLLPLLEKQFAAPKLSAGPGDQSQWRRELGDLPSAAERLVRGKMGGPCGERRLHSPPLRPALAGPRFRQGREALAVASADGCFLHPRGDRRPRGGASRLARALGSAVTHSPDKSLPALTLFSVVIPARDEEASLPSTLRNLHSAFAREAIPHELVVVDDGSQDSTWAVLQSLQAEIPELVPVRNPGPHGFGRAIVKGFDAIRGDAVVIVMADASDAPEDAVRYWRLLNEGYECVFGSRFVKGGRVVDYPRVKLLVNRAANFFIRILFAIPLNDTTNAFKAYRRGVIEGCRPFLSPHFNLTVEIPLKAIARGYSWTVTPISWQNRRHGVAKLKIKEMGSRYFFICMYVWLEKYFSRGDYRKK